MKKAIAIFFIMVMAVGLAVSAYASDYQGKEKQDSVFQKLGDLITGKYEIEGKPLKKIGIFQCTADQVKEIKSGPTR